MAYQLKNKEEFKKYVDTIHILPSTDEIAIDEFNSSSLFDLYELLTKIKNNRQISPARQELLAQKLASNFPKKLASLIHFPVNQTVLLSVENYIKDLFLGYMKHPEYLTEEKSAEMEKLKIIMAKKCPDVFLEFIQEEKNATEYQLERDYIKKTFYDVLDEHSKHTKEMQNNEDIQSGFYITVKNDFSKVRISTSGRLKAMKSVSDNVNKEMNRSLEKVIPSNLKKGITHTDLENQFDLSKISDDFYGFIVYIKGINETFHIDDDMKNTTDGKLFMKYRKQKDRNVAYLHSLTNFLDDSSSFISFSQEDYLKMRIELLDHLQYLTFQECSQEYNGLLFEPQDAKDPGTSFSKLLEASIKEYTTCSKQNSFKQHLTSSEHIKYQKELMELYKEFDSRLFDKYEFQGLKIIIPQILHNTNYMNENILRDQLGVKLCSTKVTIKKNGFCAFYAILGLPDGRKIEIQFLTHNKYICSKIGSSSHSMLDNKQVDISHFFELNDKYKENERYETLLENTIHILDITTVAQRNRLLNTSNENLTAEQQQLKKQIEFAQKNLQVKEVFPDIPITLADGSKRPCTIDEYLPIFAEYHSPKLVSVTSASSRVNKNTAAVNKKTADDNFREVLLKTDETTCLADILINRYKKILKEQPSSLDFLVKYNIQNILQENYIPKKVIDQIVVKLEHQLQNTDKSYTNSLSDIKERIEKRNGAERER